MHKLFPPAFLTFLYSWKTTTPHGHRSVLRQSDKQIREDIELYFMFKSKSTVRIQHIHERTVRDKRWGVRRGRHWNLERQDRCHLSPPAIPPHEGWQDQTVAQTAWWGDLYVWCDFRGRHRQSLRGCIQSGWLCWNSHNARGGKIVLCVHLLPIVRHLSYVRRISSSSQWEECTQLHALPVFLSSTSCLNFSEKECRAFLAFKQTETPRQYLSFEDLLG